MYWIATKLATLTKCYSHNRVIESFGFIRPCKGVCVVLGVLGEGRLERALYGVVGGRLVCYKEGVCI